VRGGWFCMTASEAATWLAQVDGTQMRNPNGDDPAAAWVILVRAPAPGPLPGRLIIAFGATVEEATAGAEREWRDLWRGYGRPH